MEINNNIEGSPESISLSREEQELLQMSPILETPYSVDAAAEIYRKASERHSAIGGIDASDLPAGAERNKRIGFRENRLKQLRKMQEQLDPLLPVDQLISDVDQYLQDNS